MNKMQENLYAKISCFLNSISYFLLLISYVLPLIGGARGTPTEERENQTQQSRHSLSPYGFPLALSFPFPPLLWQLYICSVNFCNFL